MSDKEIKMEGSISPIFIMLILVSFLALFAIGFGGWAFMGMQDYKNNVDQKISVAVKMAVDKKSTDKDNEFIEKEKLPNRTFSGNATLGSITFDYPKTWSGYLRQNDKEMTFLLQKGILEGSSIDGLSKPVVVQVLNQPYSTTLSAYEPIAKTGKSTISAYRLPKLQSVLGTKIEGLLPDGTTGEVVLLPVREKTIKIYSSIQDYIPDLNNTVLGSLSFTP